MLATPRTSFSANGWTSPSSAPTALSARADAAKFRQKSAIASPSDSSLVPCTSS